MKKLLLALTVLMVSSTLCAQENTEKSESKTVEFMSSCGTLLKKEFYNLEKVKGIENQVLILTDLKTGEKVGCMRLTTEYGSGMNTTSYTGTLDFDELDACIQSLTYIREQLLPTTPETYTEALFKTRDKLEFGAFWSSDKWKAYVQTKGYTTHSIEFMATYDLFILIKVMKEAQSIISEKTR